MPIRTLIVILLALAVVSGCGRRGSLESPGATASTPSTSAPATAISPLDPGSPPANNDVTPPTPVEAPKKRFLLDFLL
jgi:predicted small lipoprotein YifL